MVKDHSDGERAQTSTWGLALGEGRKEGVYLTTHSTHFTTVIWRWTYGKGPLR